MKRGFSLVCLLLVLFSLSSTSCAFIFGPNMKQLTAPFHDEGIIGEYKKSPNLATPVVKNGIAKIGGRGGLPDFKFSFPGIGWKYKIDLANRGYVRLTHPQDKAGIVAKVEIVKANNLLASPEKEIRIEAAKLAIKKIRQSIINENSFIIITSEPFNTEEINGKKFVICKFRVQSKSGKQSDFWIYGINYGIFNYFENSERSLRYLVWIGIFQIWQDVPNSELIKYNLKKIPETIKFTKSSPMGEIYSDLECYTFWEKF